MITNKTAKSMNTYIQDLEFRVIKTVMKKSPR